jgi:hypothetical protein
MRRRTKNIIRRWVGRGGSGGAITISLTDSHQIPPPASLPPSRATVRVQGATTGQTASRADRFEFDFLCNVFGVVTGGGGGRVISGLLW